MICIYHKNCADGFGAALAVHQFATERQLDCQFIPAYHDEVAPDVSGEDVYIVDFAYPRDTLIAMHQQANSLQVIDHHKTAQQDLDGLEYCIFNMEKSGAVLTWEFLHPDKKLPELFQFIQDRDLWIWAKPLSKQVSAALKTIDMRFDLWEKYLDDDNISELAQMGASILAYQTKQISNVMQSDISFSKIDGHLVPCINTTTLISEIGNELAQGHPFAAMYFEKGDKRLYSLRSAENGMDVSKIAKKYGGGGHYHAAGFSIDKPIVEI